MKLRNEIYYSCKQYYLYLLSNICTACTISAYISLFDSDSRFTLKGYIEDEKTKVAFKEREVTRERGSKNQINAQK